MIGAVLLAAGGSSRMGRPKQLLRYRGSSLVRRAARAALDAGCAPLIVVLGAAAEPVRAELAGLPVETVVNAGWAGGVSGSIRLGVARLSLDPRPIRAAVLLACDQPRLDATVLARLMVAFDGRSGSRVACAYGDTVGVPALFERAWFPRLTRLGGDRGAKTLLAECPALLATVPWPEGAIDVDSPEDLPALG